MLYSHAARRYSVPTRFDAAICLRVRLSRRSARLFHRLFLAGQNQDIRLATLIEEGGRPPALGA
jgi:hypothetical protein